MTNAILWLERDGKRWGLVDRPDRLAWSGDSGSDWCWSSGTASDRVHLPGCADVHDSTARVTRDDAIALVRRLAPAFGYVVRERVVARRWDEGGDRVYATDDDEDWMAASVEPGGWECWPWYGDGVKGAGGPETGPAGMAAADAWLTEHAPWVTLEGGAFVVPPEHVDAQDEAPAAERSAAPPVQPPDLSMRLDDVVRRVEALEAARVEPVAAGERVRVEVVSVPGGDRVAVRVAMADDGHLWVATYGLTRSGDGALLWLSVADADAECAAWRRRLGVAP